MILRYRPTLDLDALKASVDLAALVAESGVELRRESTSAGGSLKGSCPFCGGGEDRLVGRPARRGGEGLGRGGVPAGGGRRTPRLWTCSWPVGSASMRKSASGSGMASGPAARP